MLECVLNISEGHDGDRLVRIAAAAGSTVLDLHHDPHHNRAVLTLAADPYPLMEAVRQVTRSCVAWLDIGSHGGVHPRIGVLDVVPFVDLDQPELPATAVSLGARDAFAAWAAAELAVPCFVYGPERGLPDVRRGAWCGLVPDAGPPEPHRTAGAIAVGARGALVAYNVWVQGDDVGAARRVAGAVRRPGLRTLGLSVGGRLQISCNLTDPYKLGPAAAVDLVSSLADVEATELVGLLPGAVLGAIPERRWGELDLCADRTIEARLAARRSGASAVVATPGPPRT